LNVDALRPLSGIDVLSALDGVVYTTDLNGIVTHVSDDSWAAFARENGAPNLTPSAVLGRRLLDMFAGDAVRNYYSAIHDAIVQGAKSRVLLSFRCDAPHMERVMRMAISALSAGGRLVAVLYQSQQIEERDRSDWKASSLTSDQAAVSLPQCSFCNRVEHLTDDDERRWLSADAYVRSGGETPVTPIHTICPECLVRML
jgi:hypothetical protein